MYCGYCSCLFPRPFPSLVLDQLALFPGFPYSEVILIQLLSLSPQRQCLLVYHLEQLLLSGHPLQTESNSWLLSLHDTVISSVHFDLKIVYTILF